jgi:hypothetical protein
VVVVVVVAVLVVPGVRSALGMVIGVARVISLVASGAAVSGMVARGAGVIWTVLGSGGQRALEIGGRFGRHDGGKGFRLASKGVGEGPPGMELTPDEPIGIAAQEGKGALRPVDYEIEDGRRQRRSEAQHEREVNRRLPDVAAGEALPPVVEGGLGVRQLGIVGERFPGEIPQPERPAVHARVDDRRAVRRGDRHR